MGRTPIHLAVENNSAESVKVLAKLVNAGADINAQDKSGKTALHLAAKKGSADAVNTLVRVGAKTNPQDKDGKTPLQLTLDTGNCTPEVAMTLLNNGGQELLEKQDNAGRAVLHSAVENGRVDVVELLLKNGANPDQRDKEGKTPIFVVLEREFPNKEKIVECLYPRTKDFGEDVFGRSAAFYAAKNGVPKFSTTTLEDINGQLDIACQLGDHLAFCNLSEWAGHNLPLPTRERLSEPVFFRRLFHVVGSSTRPFERFKIVKLLLNRQKGIHHQFLDLSKEKDGNTALSLACKNGLDDTAQLLLSTSGTQLFYRMLSKGTPPPLWQAARGGYAEVVTVLLPFLGGGAGRDGQSLGGDLSRHNAPDGTSPLLVAVLACTNDGSTSSEIIQQLMHLYSADTILASVIQFGTPFLLDNIEELGIVPHSLTSVLQALVSESPRMLKRVLEALEERETVSGTEVQKLARTHGENVNTLALRRLLNLDVKPRESRLTRMSLEFPRFNPDVEEESVPAVDPDAKEVSVAELEQHVLGEFCPIARGMAEQGSNKIAAVDLEKGRCPEECRQKSDCGVVRSLTKALQLLEAELCLDSALSPLKPEFEVIGSVLEATRLGRANEMDVTIAFSGLGSRRDFLRLGRREEDGSKDAMAATVDKGSPLARFARESRAPQVKRLVFDYPGFLRHLLGAIRGGLARAGAAPGWPRDIHFQADWSPSLDCCSSYSDSQRSSLFHPFTHCRDCRPPVAHTKLGPVLTMTHRGDRGTGVLTVDLIPVFPLDSEGLGLLNLFDVLSKNLGATVHEGGSDGHTFVEGGVAHFKRMMSVDRVLPESFLEEAQKGGGVFEVAFKLINYGEENNCVVRPGQQGKYLREDELLRKGDPGIPNRMSLPKVYTYLKCLKSKLRIGGITSYSIKKVVLTREMRLQLDWSGVDLGRAGEVLYHALSYPDLRRAFEKAVDFKKWRERMGAPEGDGEGVIPLLRSRPGATDQRREDDSSGRGSSGDAEDQEDADGSPQQNSSVTEGSDSDINSEDAEEETAVHVEVHRADEQANEVIAEAEEEEEEAGGSSVAAAEEEENHNEDKEHNSKQRVSSNDRKERGSYSGMNSQDAAGETTV